MDAEQLSETFEVVAPCRPFPDGCRLSDLLLTQTGIQLILLAGKYFKAGQYTEMTGVFDETRRINNINCVLAGGACARIQAAQQLLAFAVEPKPSR